MSDLVFLSSDVSSAVNHHSSCPNHTAFFLFLKHRTLIPTLGPFYQLSSPNHISSLEHRLAIASHLGLSLNVTSSVRLLTT